MCVTKWRKGSWKQMEIWNTSWRRAAISPRYQEEEVISFCVEKVSRKSGACLNEDMP